jgi:hypothetical protein
MDRTHAYFFATEVGVMIAGRVSSTWRLSVVLCLLAYGCGQEPHGGQGLTKGGAELRLVDSVVLEEQDTLYVGLIRMGIVVDGAGKLYIGSSPFRSILRYNRNGRVEATYRLPKYRGPMSMGPVLYADDSVVVVTDSPGYRIFVFRATDGRLLSNTPYRGYIGSVEVVAGRLWFGNLSSADKRVVGSVELKELLAADSTVSRGLLTPALLNTPTEFAKYPELDLGSQVLVRNYGDTILVGFSALNNLFRLVPSSGEIDTIRPPSRLRRGVPITALESYFAKRRFRYDRALGSISVLDGIWRRPNGQTMLVHMDSKAVMDGPKLISVRATPYVTLLSGDLREACLDARIEAPPGSRPVVTVLGDTIYVVDQRMEASDPSKPRTVLRRFLIDDTSCQWMRIRTGGE